MLHESFTKHGHEIILLLRQTKITFYVKHMWPKTPTNLPFRNRLCHSGAARPCGDLPWMEQYRNDLFVMIAVMLEPHSAPVKMNISLFPDKCIHQPEERTEMGLGELKVFWWSLFNFLQAVTSAESPHTRSWWIGRAFLVGHFRHHTDISLLRWLNYSSFTQMASVSVIWTRFTPKYK